MFPTAEGCGLTAFWLRPKTAIEMAFAFLVVSCTSGPVPAKFSISGPTTLNNSICSAVYTVSMVDSNNSSVVSPSEIEVFFSLIVTNVAGGFFFSDPACTQRVESIKLKRDTSSVTFYFLGSATPKLSLVADDGQGGIDPGNLEVTFQ